MTISRQPHRSQEDLLMNRCYKGSLALLIAVFPAGAQLLWGEAPRPATKTPADPAATRLLAEARLARAHWANFPGFRADLKVNLDGAVYGGNAQVNAEGKVTVQLTDGAAAAWAKRLLASTAGHRLDSTAALTTPCAFADETIHHPLGRAIRVLNDEFHSSYRIRERQIIVVNRQMQDARFTITVLHNHVNAEHQFLPAAYVVNTWDLKTNALRSSEAFHQTWRRVGKFDLPETTLVVTATSKSQEARSLTLTNHQLLQ
jgi:hypothetical protein